MAKQVGTSDDFTLTDQKTTVQTNSPSARNHVEEPLNNESYYQPSPFYSVCTGLGRLMPWDMIIPSTCFAASAVCWYDPNLCPSLSFMMLGFFVLFFESIVTYFKGYAFRGIRGGMVEFMELLTREEKTKKKDCPLDALAHVISRMSESETMFAALKRSTSKFLSDEDFAQDIIIMVQRSLIKASESVDLQRTIEGMTKKSIVAAVSDQSFLKELMRHIMEAIVASSQDEDLTSAIRSIVREAVRDAFSDEEFNNVLTNAISNQLSDGALYRAAASGIMKAPFGRNKPSSENKN
mmetsp:Transcript_6757/g.9861  ORF Transcript_6757/g.9861 Transcript_6757/m.9861 type:complete len:294 (+) Transcript_6757:57-938(+)